MLLTVTLRDSVQVPPLSHDATLLEIKDWVCLSVLLSHICYHTILKFKLQKILWAMYLF